MSQNKINKLSVTRDARPSRSAPLVVFLACSIFQYTRFFSSPYDVNKSDDVIGIELKILLYLDSQANVCSQHIVFMCGWSFLSCCGLYVSRHLLSLWLAMCRLSMIFVISNHICCQSPGSGSGFFATFKLSK